MKTTILAVAITLVWAVLFMTGNASAAFATNESGISAYVNVGTSINLDNASLAYKNIEDRTSTYVIGVVEVPNASDYELPHVFTSADGWIMAYYAKEKPRALIMPWGQFDINNPDLNQLSNSRLEEAISIVSSSIFVSYSTIKSNTKYYDFQYPDANTLTLIAESRAISGVDSFNFRIPSEFTLYNVSWEYFSFDCSDCWFHLNNKELIGTDGTYNHNTSSANGYSGSIEEKYFGTIDALSKDELHKGDLRYNYYASDQGSSNIAIALIYKAP